MQVVKSAAMFTNIGDIDDAVLEGLLNDVAIGHSSLQRLNGQCALVKARRKVQTAIPQDADIAEREWEVIKGQFPLSCHVDFVGRWACAAV